MNFNGAKLAVLRIVGRVLLAIWDVVWKALVIIGLLVSLATGGIQLAEKQGLIEGGNPLKAAVELPEKFEHWLDVTAAAAEKYCAEGGCPGIE